MSSPDDEDGTHTLQDKTSDFKLITLLIKLVDDAQSAIKDGTSRLDWLEASY